MIAFVRRRLASLQRSFGAIAGATILAVAVNAPLPAVADNAYQCEAGPDDAIVNACAARWEAATIRAHVTLNVYGGASAECLSATADALEGAAAKWLADDKFTSFAGPWPCGREPAVAKANDDALAQVCPNAVWSYNNKGVSGCTGAAAAPPPPPPLAAPAPTTQVMPAQGGGGTPLTVGIVPSDAAVPALYAYQSGLFRKYGLDVQLNMMNNSAAIAAGVAGGALDVGLTNTVSFAVAHSRGLPFVAIAGGTVYSASAPTSVLCVGRTSPLNTLKDLEGKTVAVSGMGNLDQLGLQAWMEKNGGDPRSLRLVEVPFAAMGPALQTGRVDAAVIDEPFFSAARSQVRVFARELDGISSGPFSLTSWFTSSTWAAAAGDIVARFSRALAEAATYANAHQAETAALLSTYSKLDPSVVANMTRATYDANLSAQSLQPVVDAIARYGLIQGSFPAQELIFRR